MVWQNLWHSWHGLMLLCTVTRLEISSSKGRTDRSLGAMTNDVADEDTGHTVLHAYVECSQDLYQD